MNPVEIVSLLETRGIRLWKEDGALRYSAPPGAMTESLKLLLTSHRLSILQFLPDGLHLNGNITLRALSDGQQRLWFLQTLVPTSPFLNVVGALRLRGRIDGADIEAAFQHLVYRHEQLRSAFCLEDEFPNQIIRRQLPGPFVSVIDAPAVSEQERPERIAALASAECNGLFTLDKAPLFKCSLIRFDEKDQGLVLVMHHLICDHWSMGVLFRDLLVYLEKDNAGYIDTVLTSAASTHEDTADSGLAFWQTELASLQQIDLPVAKPRPPSKSYRASGFARSVGLASDIKSLARAQGVTPFAVLVASFAAGMHRFGAGSDITIGTDVALRESARSENSVGFLVNQMALRTRPTSSTSFRDFVTASGRTVVQAMEHRDVPFQRVVSEIGVVRDLSRHPVFDIGLTFQNTPPIVSNSSALDIESIDVPVHGSQLDLEVVAEFRRSDVHFHWRYALDLFDRETVAQMANSLEILLKDALLNPDKALGDLKIMDDGELAPIRHSADRNNRIATHETFLAHFEHAVAAWSKREAARCGSARLSYAELDARSRAFASGLRRKGIKPGDTVGVMAERGLDMLTALIAIFRAGAAYLPLDSRHPARRIESMLHRSGCGSVISSLTLRTHIDCVADISIWSFEEIERAATADSEAPVAEISPKYAAYIIPTSGSTGEPKIATVTHQGMYNHLLAKIEDLNLCHNDVCCQTAPPSFDISIWQFLACLLVGGTTLILPDDIANDPANLLAALHEYDASILQSVPAMLAGMLGETGERPIVAPTLRWLIATGEALPPEVSRRWFARCQVPIMNAYGPAECSDDVTHAFITSAPPREAQRSPIGLPIRNAELLIVNDRLQPVPPGVPGELLVAGEVVGDGYVNAPSVTAATLLPDFFSGRIGARCYRTGDIVRQNGEGMLEFVGRADHQVKLRGMRADLGDIEAALLRCDGVDAAVAVPIVRENTVIGLGAYIVGAPAQDSDLTRQLEQHLPVFMIPSKIVLLPALPVNTNGKVDRKQLPPLNDHSIDMVTPPVSDTEKRIADIWGQLLNVESDTVGQQSQFFVMGGHSILAARMVRRVGQMSGIDIPLAFIFRWPDLFGFAQAVDSALQAQLHRLADKARTTGG